MTSSQNRKFKVKTLSDNIYDFQVDENMKISDLKVLIAQKTNVPADRQRLVFMAKMLENDQTVGNYLKQDDKTIHLMAKIAENTQNQPNQQGAAQSSQQQQSQPQQQPQQPGNNPLAGMLGNLSGMFGFDPMAMIQQISNQPPGAFNIIRSGPIIGPPGQGGSQQPMGDNPIFGAFGFPRSPISVQQASQPQPNQSQQSQPTSNTSNNTSNQPQQPRQPQQQQQQSFQVFPPQQQQAQQQNHQHHHHHGHNHDHQHQPNINVLPFQQLQSLGLSLNQMMGPGATFPGPPLPPVQNRNQAQILGGYLSQWHFQMSRLLPFIQRLSELLQRQPLMNNQNDRALTQQMINRVPGLFDAVSNTTRNVIPHYSNLRLGNAPGQFSVAGQNQSQVQNQNQQGNADNPNPFGGIIGQPIVSVQIVASNDPFAQNPPSNNLNPVGGNVPPSNTGNNNNNSSQQDQNAFINNFTNSLNDILPNLQGLIGGLMPGGMISPPQPIQVQPQPQQQSQRPQSQPSSNPTVSSIPPASTSQPITLTSTNNSIRQPEAESQPQSQPSSTNPPQPINPLNALQGFMSNNNVSNLLTTQNINMATNANLRYMISEGQQISPQNQSIYSLIFGDITGGELIQLFTSNNYSFFENRRADFRRGLQTALGRYENSRQALAERITSDILPILVSEELTAASIEGFDAELVAREIISKHSLILISLILDDQPDFSNRLIKQIRLMVGELIYELQEGSTKDVPFIISCIKAGGARVMDPYMMGMSGLIFMMFDRGMYGSYQEYKQAKEKSQKMTEEDHQKEKSLLERIQKQAEEDKDYFERFVQKDKSKYFR